MKILTICIPTYNRSEILFPLINKLLSLSDDRFNLVVQDNKSTDDTFKLIHSIKDDRFFYFSNNKNEGPSFNYIKSLTHEIAEYVLLCLDKDDILTQNLSVFIDFLENQKPSFGYVNLNTPSEFKLDFYSKGFLSIKKMAYLNKHPTGYFYKSNVFIKYIHQSFFKNLDMTFPFPFEIINAHIAVDNDACLVHLPLLQQESLYNAKNIKSYTYNNDNLFFSPKNQYNIFALYLNDLNYLHVPNAVKSRMSKILLRKVLIAVSINYKNMLNNDIICAHYCIEKRSMNFFEMHSNILNAMRIYLIASNNYYSFSRLVVCWAYFEILIRITKSSIGRFLKIFN